MKRHILFALVYAALAMACGVFYREFTKGYGFTGDTALGRVHTHLFLLGMVVFLLFALFDAKLDLQKHRLYLPFMIVYNAGVGVMSVMLIVRGVFDVTGGMSAGADGVDELRLFLGRVGVVEKEVALSAVSERRAEVDEHALCVPDVQVAVRLGREARLHLLGAQLARGYVLIDDLFDEVGRFGKGGNFRFFRHKKYLYLSV